MDSRIGGDPLGILKAPKQSPSSGGDPLGILKKKASSESGLNGSTQFISPSNLPSGLQEGSSVFPTKENPLPLLETPKTVTTFDGTPLYISPDDKSPYANALRQSPSALSQLQQRVLSKTTTPLDLEVLSSGSNKSVAATQAYITKGKDVGTATDINDNTQSTEQFLKNSISGLSKEMGAVNNPDEIANNPDEGASFLSKLHTAIKATQGMSGYLQGVVPFVKSAYDVAENLLSGKVDKNKLATDVQQLSENAGTKVEDKQKAFVAQAQKALPVLVQNITDQTAKEAFDKGIEDSQAIDLLYKRLDPESYEKSVEMRNATPQSASTKVGTSILNGVAAIKNFSDWVTNADENNKELLNAEKGQYELLLNRGLGNYAAQLKAKGISTGDQQLIEQANTLIPKIQDESAIVEKYPMLIKQQMADYINQRYAEETGILNGTEVQGANGRLLKYGGVNTDAAKRYLREGGFYDKPNFKDYADDVAEHPATYLATGNTVAGAPMQFLNVFKSIFNSVADLEGFRTAEDRHAENIKSQMFPSELTENIKPDISFDLGGHHFETTVAKTLNGVAHLGGYMATAALGSAIGGAAGLSGSAAARVGAWSSFGADAIDSGLKTADQLNLTPAQSWLYAGMNAVMMAEGGRLLEFGKATPVPQIAGVNQKIADAAIGLTNKTLTEGAAKELVDGAVNTWAGALKKWGIGTAKGAGVMTAFGVGDKMLRVAAGDPNANLNDILPEAANAYFDGVLTMGVIGGFGLPADIAKAKNSTYKAALSSIVDNHDAAKDILQIGLDRGLFSKQEYDQKVAVLNTGLKAKASLNGAIAKTGVSIDGKQRQTWIANATAEKVLRDQAEKEGVSQEEAAQYIKQADALKEQNGKIFNGLKFSKLLEPQYNLYDAQQALNEAQKVYAETPTLENEQSVIDKKAIFDKFNENYLNGIPENKTNETAQAENTVPVSTEKTGTTNEAVDNVSKEAEAGTFEDKVRELYPALKNTDDAGVNDFIKENATDTPSKFINDFGQDKFNEVVKSIPTKELQNKLDIILDNNSDSKDVDILDKLISDRESEPQAEQQPIVNSNIYDVVKYEPIGGGKLMDFVKIGNKYIDPDVSKHNEALSGLPVSELSNEAVIKQRVDDLYHDKEMESDSGMDISELNNAISFLEKFLPENKPTISKEQTEPTTKEVEGAQSGFTPKDVIDEGYKKIKNSIGQKKAQKYFEQVDRLLNPNENNIVEYRENGVVTKEGDKYTFHALSDMDLKNWRLGFKRDISDQFTKQNPASKVEGVSSNSNEGNSALRDVESTAKALDDIYWEDKREGKVNQSKIIDLIPKDEVNDPNLNGFYRVSNMDDAFVNGMQKDAKDRIGKLNEIYRDRNKHEVISEAYHRAKKDNSNPELVKAVEYLINKNEPNKTTTEDKPSVSTNEKTDQSSEPTNKVENNSKNKQTEVPKPSTQSPLPTKEEISKYSAKDKLALVNAVRNKDAKAIQEITERNRGGNVKFDKSNNADAAFETRDGKRIGFDYDTDKVARERFDFSKLKQIGKGSDRTVFDLGDGKVLKVAHTARGLEQNIYEGDRYLKGIVPDVHERGLNYVVTDKVPRIKANDIVPTYDIETGEQNGTAKAGEMIRELGKFNQKDFDNKTSGIQDALRKYGLGDVMDYDVLYGDFKAGRNWGYENGRPVHIDGGTFGGTRMLDNYKGKAPLSDPEFRDIYNKSKALKKQFGDTDKNTKFQKSEIKTDEGTMPVEQYVSRAKAVLEKLFPKAKFEAYDTTADYLDAGGTYGSKGLSRVDGKGNRTIMLDLQEIRDSGSGKTAFHEVIHPIVDEVVGERPEELNPLWNSLAEQMKDVKGFDKVLLHVMNYGAHEHPAAEGITELLTQISEGNISLDAVPPARKGVIIDLLNKLFEKLGLNIRFGDSYDFKSFATDIKKAFETGDTESLKQVVDKKSEENQRAKDNASKISKFLFGSDKADKSETDINDVVKQLRELGLTDKEIEEGLKQSGDSEADIKRALGGGGKSGNGGETEGLGQGDGNAITHAAIDDFRREMGFEPFSHIRMTDAEVNAKADKAIADGYDVQNLFHDIAKGHNPNEVEVVILKKTKTAIDAAVEKNPSKANLKKAADFATASDVAGQIAGRAFRLRQDIDEVDVGKQSLSDFFVTRMRNKGVTPETMTDAQKSEIQKQYKDLKDAHDKLEAKVAKLVEADAKRKAESAVKKMKDRTSSQPKKTHEEYVKERKSLVEQLKAAKAKAEERMKGITKSGFSVTVTPEMVKIIGKIAYSHVSEGAQKLQEVSQKVYNEIKDVFEGVTQQDVVDVLAGAYNAVKPEKNDILKQIAALRSEAIKESSLAKERKDAQRLKTIKKTYQRKIDKLKEDLRTGKYLQEKDKPEPLKLDKEALALKDQYISIKQETQRLIAKDEWNKKTQGEKFKHNALEALNIPRTAMTFLDFSAVLSQAAVPTIVHPDLAAKSLPGMFKDTFSQKKFDRWLFDLKGSELYNEMKSIGEVYISDPHDGRLDKKEEAFMNNLIEKIPFIGTWLVKGSERAYLSYLNRMRVELYALGRDVLIRNGKTPENSPEAFKGLGSYVNNMTGRGGVPKSLELATPLISAGIFAPRLIASRLNLLGITDIPNIGVKVGTLGKHSIESGFYTKLPPEIRKMAILDMAKFVMFGSAVIGLAALVGNDDKKDKAVEFDARSSDFGKIKVGNTRYDIWGGFQPYITLFARMTGKTKSVNNGKMYTLDGKGAFGRTRADVLESFVRGKSSPVVGMVWDALKGGRTIVGDKILYDKINPFGDHKKKEVTMGSYLANHFLPMSGGDIYDALKDGDARNLVAIPSIIFGIHVQTFDNEK